jgi:predicted GH43/DUF377 family glycosyl hydrolase
MSLLFSDFGGKTWKLRRYIDSSDFGWSAFNPSISYSPSEGYAVLFRSSNYYFDPESGEPFKTGAGKDPYLIENRLWFAKLSEDLEIVEDTLQEVTFNPWEIPMIRGAEDARLYWRDTGWEFSATVYERDTIPYPRMARFKLENYKATILNFYVVSSNKPFQQVEKNWMPTNIATDKFNYIYSQTSIFSNERGIVEVRSVPELEKSLRGGTQLVLLDSGDYLAVVHETVDNYVEKYSSRIFGVRLVNFRKYFHRFARYTSDGVLSGVSDRFKFDDADIEFAAGLVVQDQDLVISYGRKDIVSMLAKIKLSKVLEMIKDV